MEMHFDRRKGGWDGQKEIFWVVMMCIWSSNCRIHLFSSSEPGSNPRVGQTDWRVIIGVSEASILQFWAIYWQGLHIVLTNTNHSVHSGTSRVLYTGPFGQFWRYIFN